MKQGIIPVFIRELHRMVSRPIYLMMTIIIPIIIIVFFATFLNQGLPTNMPIGVVDMDNSSTSRLIIRNIDAGQVCDVSFRLDSYEMAKVAMQRGQIYSFILIPQHFNHDLQSGKTPYVVFYTQYAHYLASSLIMREIKTTLTTIAYGVNMKVRQAKGEDPQTIMADIQPIKLEAHLIGNPMTNYSYYLTSILMPGIIFLMAMICTIYCIGTELKFGTSKRWLATAGGHIWKALLGKLAPYTILYFLMLAAAYIVMNKMMGFPANGNILLMFLGSLMSVIAYQSMGIFMIGMLPAMRDALSIGAFYGVIGFTLCGFTYPNLAMLPAVRPYSLLYPVTQYYNLYANIQINGLSFAQTWQPFLILFAFNLFAISVMIRLKIACIRLNFPRE